VHRELHAHPDHPARERRRLLPGGRELANRQRLPRRVRQRAPRGRESCDTGITSGSGKCPTAADCNDSKPCTADSVSGSGCSAKCVNTTLGPSLAGKDGCCPAGATSLTDSDCAVVCGNSLVESGEKCDTGILAGAGKCPTLADCNDGNVCTVDSLSGGGCTVACQHTNATPNATPRTAAARSAPRP